MTTTNAASDDRDLLLHHLDVQRRHVLGALEGLDDEQLRRPVLPWGWSFLGLVRHLTLGDERYWFDHVVGGRPMDWWPEPPRTDWTVNDDEEAAAVLDGYRDAIAASDEVLADVSVEDAPRRPDPDWEEWGMAFPRVRDVLLHVITETAVHAGHLDATRELLDGSQWIVLDD